VTRQSYQRGHVEGPIRTRTGVVYKIHWRVRKVDSGWKHMKETLYNLQGKKAAEAVLQSRIREAFAIAPETTNLTFQEFVETFWEPYLARSCGKVCSRCPG
jgi:hypothetical protein